MRKILSGILCTILMLSLVACSGGNGSRTGEDNPEAELRTDIEGIEKLFPALEGAVTEVDWEMKRLGTGDTFLPGKYAYQCQGYITLSDEAAEKYASSYEWTDVSPKVEFEAVTEREGNWKASHDFEQEVFDGHITGHVWLDGNTILFTLIDE